MEQTTCPAPLDGAQLLAEGGEAKQKILFLLRYSRKAKVVLKELDPKDEYVVELDQRESKVVDLIK